MTLEEAKKLLGTVEKALYIGPKASINEMASYRRKLLSVKQSASYTAAKRMVMEHNEKKGA